MDAQDVMIDVRNLSKSYGNVQAVTDVSFTVGNQQVLGFLGPNGAGKTTIMKILTGFHYPSGGSAVVDGFSVDDDPLEIKKRIGYLPENVPLYGDLTVEEYLYFTAAARLIPKRKRKEAVEESMKTCAIATHRGLKIETLSKGYRQRTGLAQAILHDPPILILDEPTTGLDPNQIIEIRSLIKELGKRKTVILSTHILQEVEAICSAVLIINDGKIAAQGKPEEIAGSIKGGDTWELAVKNASSADEINEKLKYLGQASNVSVQMSDNGTFNVSFFLAGGADCGEGIFDWAVENNYKILEMNRKKISIEDIFVKLTGDRVPAEQNETPKEGGKNE